MMYKLNNNYKIETKNKIFYTGKVLQEDNISIKLKTIKDEIIILNKEEIKHAIKFGTDNEEENDDETKNIWEKAY